ncbi:MAG: ATP-binding protein [Candidatus Eisenbacteria sp.]|nr:ATP-binding protein [Candidatus Eisenbacteria bacterium]
MIEEELQRKAQDFRELGLPAYVPRAGRVHLVDNMVSTVVGARRAGKSFRVLQIADELIKEGVIKSLDQVCPVDFDNPIISSMRAQDLKLIQSTFLKISPELGLKTPIIFLLDEIHKIVGWEEYAIDLSRNRYWRVVVTGSSSKLLKEDMATELRGKAISSTVYPLSFAEYLKFNGFHYSYSSTKGQADARRLFEDYLRWGGYPAIPATDEYSRDVLLREYFDTMILKDIIQRHDVSKPQQCIQLYYYLLSNIGKPHTLKSAYEFLKQGGYATSRDAVRDYLKWAQDAWLLYAVPIFSDSVKKQQRNYRKIYCIDWALALRNSLVWDGSHACAFENMVFVHLLRNHPRVHYYLTRAKRQEVDFLVIDDRGDAVLAIQVCVDISAQDTLRRELEPLVSVAKYFGTKENLIITLNQQAEFEEDRVVVRAIPAWKWMLGID